MDAPKVYRTTMLFPLGENDSSLSLSFCPWQGQDQQFNPIWLDETFMTVYSDTSSEEENFFHIAPLETSPLTECDLSTISFVTSTNSSFTEESEPPCITPRIYSQVTSAPLTFSQLSYMNPTRYLSMRSMTPTRYLKECSMNEEDEGNQDELTTP